MIDNASALWILEKENLTSEDKKIIRKHIEVLTDLIGHLETDNMVLKDIIDQGQYLDSQVIAARKRIVNQSGSQEV